MNHKVEIQFHLTDEDGNEVKNIPAGILLFIANELENTDNRQGELQTSVNGVSYSGWWKCNYQTDDLGNFADQRLTIDEGYDEDEDEDEGYDDYYEDEDEDDDYYEDEDEDDDYYEDEDEDDDYYEDEGITYIGAWQIYFYFDKWLVRWGGKGGRVMEEFTGDLAGRERAIAFCQENKR